jgi:ABC-type phosphate transport system permease subunit
MPPLLLTLVSRGTGVELSAVAMGVGLGALVAVPVALGGGIFSAQTGVERSSWLASVAGCLGRIPTLLTTVFFGMAAVTLGRVESAALWGFVAMLAGAPVIWRIVARALSELPPGILESAAALGLSRMRTMWLTGFPVVGPTLLGAACIGAARALTVGWVVSELRLGSGWVSLADWWPLAAWVVIVTLGGTLLLGSGRRCSKALERAAS